jgi:hypothetical protein
MICLNCCMTSDGYHGKPVSGKGVEASIEYFLLRDLYKNIEGSL